MRINAIIVLLVISSSPMHAQMGANDQSFNVFDNGERNGGYGSSVVGALELPDGKKLLYGTIVSDGVTSTSIVRITTDGRLDPTFFINQPSAGYIKSAALQSNGKIVIGGTFQYFNGVATGRITRLMPDGQVDNSFSSISGFDADVESIAIDDVDRIYVSGDFSTFDGVSRNRIARLESDGSLDLNYDPGSNLNISSSSSYVKCKLSAQGLAYYFYSSIYITSQLSRVLETGQIDTTFHFENLLSYAIRDVEVLSDDRVVLSNVENISYTDSAVYIINYDGSVDISFNPIAINGRVNSAKYINNGTILILGDYSFANGVVRRGLSTVDLNGNIMDVGPLDTYLYNNADYKGALETSQNQILIFGAFSRYHLYNKWGLVLTDYLGEIDWSFAPCGGADGSVNSLKRANYGNLLYIGGTFSAFNGFPSAGVARLFPNGDVDTAFSTSIGPRHDSSYYYTWNVFDIEPSSIDNTIYVAGNFGHFNNYPCGNIVRLTDSGSVDLTFDVGEGFTGGQVNVVKALSDGKVLVGGRFTAYKGMPANHIARLNPDGSRDFSFQGGSGFEGSTCDCSQAGGLWAYPEVETIEIDADNSLIIGGKFNSYDGNNTRNLVRLNYDGTFNSDISEQCDFGGWTLWCACNQYVYGSIYRLFRQQNGKLLIGGNFSSVNGTTCSNNIRLDQTCQLDIDFNTTTFTDALPLGADSNNRSYISSIENTNVVGNSNLFRINEDGSFDNSLNTGSGFNYGGVQRMLIDIDGSLIVAGGFSSYNGITRHGVARITHGPVDISSSIKNLNFQAYYSNGLLRIDVSEEQKISGRIVVSDLMGRNIVSSSISSNTLSIPLTLSNGIYTIQLTMEDAIGSKKFCIMD